MTTDLTIMLENRPGTAADACEAMGRLNVNIEGLCAFASQGIGILHAAVEDAAAARKAVEDLGLRVNEEREVIIVQIEDRPGAAGEVLRKIGDADLNVDFTYFATATRMIVCAQDLEKARAVL